MFISVPGSQVITLVTEPYKPISEQKLHLINHNVPVSLRASS